MEAAAEKHALGDAPADPAELERKRDRDGLLLSRARVVHQLESAQNPNHRRMLQQALNDLDARLAQVSK